MTFQLPAFELLGKMEFRLSEFHRLSNILRDGKFTATQLDTPGIPECLAFCATSKYAGKIAQNELISCVITTDELADRFAGKAGLATTVDPLIEFYRIHNSIAAKYKQLRLTCHGVDATANIHHSAFVSNSCYVGKYVQIHPRAVVLDGTYIGNNSVIGPNVVIGSEGLEFKRLGDGTLLKVDHMGGVRIGEGVEVMAGSVVSKDVYLGLTDIGDGTKIGPLVNIGHRVKIGTDCLIAGNATIAGSARIGNNVRIGPSATISSSITVKSGAQVSIGSVVVKDVSIDCRVSGIFAMNHRESLLAHAQLSQRIRHIS